MKRWIAAVCAAAMTAGADEFFVYTGKPVVEPATLVFSNEAPRASDKVRVCTFNLENFTDGIGDEPTRDGAVAARQASMAAERINIIQPDILVLQEIENAAMVRLLNESIDPPMPIAYMTKLGSGSTDIPKLNLVVLSRVAIDDVTEIDFGPLQGPGRPTRGLLRFDVPLDDARSLLLYVVHLKSNFGNRDRNIAQRKHALTIVRRDADARKASDTNHTWEVVVLGDYNVDPDGEAFATDDSLAPIGDWVDLWRKVDAPERVTLPTRMRDPALEFPPVAFDRFVVTPNLLDPPWTSSLPRSLPGSVATNDVTIAPGFENHVSDHLPAYIDVVR